MLLALCVLAGVLVAGMAFPGALALGMVSNEAGDNVNSVSTDLATGQLPQTSTIAAFIAGEIWSAGTGSRFWSNR